MKVKREDTLLCPSCYIPVSPDTFEEVCYLGTYSCPNCPNNWKYNNLIRASKLETLINKAIDEEDIKNGKICRY